jgi:hypothetical protein
VDGTPTEVIESDGDARFMPQTTARRIAELLIEDHPGDDSFDVDFLDAKFTEYLIEALLSLGCSVERLGPNTRLRVTCRSAAKEKTATK